MAVYCLFLVFSRIPQNVPNVLNFILVELFFCLHPYHQHTHRRSIYTLPPANIQSKRMNIPNPIVRVRSAQVGVLIRWSWSSLLSPTAAMRLRLDMFARSFSQASPSSTPRRTPKILGKTPTRTTGVECGGEKGSGNGKGKVISNWNWSSGVYDLQFWNRQCFLNLESPW